MKVETTNLGVSGTCLQEQVIVSYETLLRLFGEPNALTDDYKTDAEWNLKIDGDRVVTIYNWKNGRNYLGTDGLPVEQIVRWNIGAHDYDSASELKKFILAEIEK
jgi:hypothetical protein